MRSMNPMNQEHRFDNNLKTLRKNTGMRQLDVASLLGHTSADRISHWEKGLAVPSLVNLFKLSIIYRTSPQELYPELHAAITDELKKERAGGDPLRKLE